MKTIAQILFATLVLGSSAQSSDLPQSIACATNPLTTTFELNREGEFMVLKLFHHNGTMYAPIFTGTVTEADLSGLKDRGRLFEQMGNPIEYRFPISDCKVEKNSFYCRDSIYTKIGGIEVRHPNFMIQRYEVGNVDSERTYIYDEASFGFAVKRTYNSYEGLSMDMKYYLPRGCTRFHTAPNLKN